MGRKIKPRTPRETTLTVVVWASIALMLAIAAFAMTDAGLAFTHATATGDYAGFRNAGVEEDHWAVVTGLWLHGLR